MERIKDRRLEKTLERESQVYDDNQKVFVLHQETETDPFVFKIYGVISKVELISVLEC